MNRITGPLLVLVVLLGLPAQARARELTATPATLNAILPTLLAGDTLTLEAGAYSHFTLNGLQGTAAAPIIIAGPSSGAPAVVHADPGPCCNTIEIRNAEFVTLRRLTVDGDMVDGAFGVNASGPTVHHITVEDCHFVEHDTGQQNVAISTKAPTAGWVIRNNIIEGAGTGMYLGNSDGSDPFVDGLIEHNVFSGTIGYNVQIKWQSPHGPVPGAVAGPSRTVIRHNVFVKDDRPSPDGDRPNLLVGGFPVSGDNSNDTYEVYGNVFFHNPRESLFQGSGRVSVHDNLFVDVAGTAIRLQNHDLPLRRAWVYNNTIVAAGTGIGLSTTPPEGSVAVGNVIFAATPLSGTPTLSSNNVTGAANTAGTFLVNPDGVLGMFDLYPRVGTLQGPALELSTFASDQDAQVDFNCRPKGALLFRGAYAGEGTNPGWRPARERKPACSDVTLDGGSAGMDATVPADSGSPVDSGALGDGAMVVVDGGGRPDAAPLSDAAVPADAARPDAGSATEEEPNRCSCLNSRGPHGGLAPLGMLLVATGLLRARRPLHRKVS